MEPRHALLDTGAGRAIVGRAAIEQIEKELAESGLRILWIPPKHYVEQPKAQGVGGMAKVCGVALVPMRIGRCSGVVEFVVLQDCTPPQLPC
jgi:hypothetical protein